MTLASGKTKSLVDDVMSTQAPTGATNGFWNDTIEEKTASLRRSSQEISSSPAFDGLLEKRHDVEAQVLEDVSTRSESRISLGRKMLFLGLYFILNLALTLSNKAVLGKVCSIPHVHS